MLTAQEIRRKFLDHFVKKGHTELPSSSLVPKDDPSLLFTNAGMVQFKRVFQGLEKRPYVRATTAQKCLRVGGKHNDLDNVGRTTRHHTFFEMLGNFSFGDYFKEDAIRFAWSFVTEELKLPKERLYVTVYKDDDEAFDLWVKAAGVDPSHIRRLGEKDNFWSMGDTGPCGPCSEIHYDQGADMACGPDCGIGTCDCDRFLEIWNLVFMQYNQLPDGTRIELPTPSIDTGMGLERISAICQGVRSNYDTDLFQEFIQYMAGLAGVGYHDNPDTDTALRVIADHSRAIAFMIADGILPSNEGRSYILRRLIRRAYRFGRLIGMTEPFLYKMALKVVDVMGRQYSELGERADFMARVIREEEERFGQTLDKGLALLETEMRKRGAGGHLPGELLFRLYDTYGFPIDIVNDIADKRGFLIDEAGFNAAMKEQRDRARAQWKGSGEKDLGSRFRVLLSDGLKCEFIGYDKLRSEARIVALLDADAMAADTLPAGSEGYVVVDRPVFYGASGGQIGDIGSLTVVSEEETGRALVLDTLKPAPSLYVLKVHVAEGRLLPDEEVYQRVDQTVRNAAARNHTCTHLLQAALRRVLGDHVRQAGSLVTDERLRFDFSHIAPMTEAEIAEVQMQVNAAIMADYSVTATLMSKDDAVQIGAMALFNEKYGDTVRVITVGDGRRKESVELCGGTHLARTGQAGGFMILSESGISAGVRRIEAVTGFNALTLAQDDRDIVRDLTVQLKSRPEDLVTKVDALQKEVKALRRELDKARADAGQSGGMADETVNGIRLVTGQLAPMSVKTLRGVMDDVRSKTASGVVCLAAPDDADPAGKVALILFVSKDLHGKVTAPALIKPVAACVSGSGGGRPDQAQAGGNDPSGIGRAFDTLRELLK